MYYNPTTQGFPFGGMGYNIPPNPIGNMGNGSYPSNPYYNTAQNPNSVGFGGGYYSGNYNYQNPYLYQKQMEIEQTKRRAQMDFEKSILKKQLQAYNAYHGIQMTEEELERKVSPQEFKQDDHIEWKYLTEQEREDCRDKMIYEQTIRDNMQSIYNIMYLPRTPYVSPEEMAEAQRINNVKSMYEKITRPDMGLAEYFTEAVPKLAAVQDAIELRKQQSNLTKVYNSKEYNNLLNRHKNQFGTVLAPFESSIDDQEIKLPVSISDEQRQIRKRAFLESIMKQQKSTEASMY